MGKSPSVRRVLVEIKKSRKAKKKSKSPSVRRVLVEIARPALELSPRKTSPSVRRVLVEIEIYNEAGV